jgi:RNA-directed DNA polymerase
MDFLNFFPSIKRNDVLVYLTTRAPEKAKDWNSPDRDLFADLVCRDACLTIGSPTSPGLSNALCFDLDRKLAGLAQGNDAKYTRYADDLFFSTSIPDVLASIPNEVGKILEGIPLPSALQVNASKTRHSSKKGRRQVTGLVLSTANTVGIGRKRKRYIRSLIFKYDTLTDKEKSTLAGLLAFAKSIEPDFINALVLKYGSPLLSQVRYPVKD